MDPRDAASFIGELNARVRREGPQVALEPLADMRAWGRLPEPCQDLVISRIAALLAPRLRHLGTRVHACGEAAHRIASFGLALDDGPGGLAGWWRGGRGELELQLIPGGTCVLGDALFNEANPPRAYTIPGPFLLGRTPVTVGEWGAGGGSARAGHREVPVTSVSFAEACAWLARWGLRLPRELEWEHACRAGTASAYYWGRRPDARYAWTRASSTRRLYGEASPVKVSAHAAGANAFGLVDMSGNVEEWCEDTFSSRYQKRLAVERVVRGGHIRQSPGCARSGWRAWAHVSDARPFLGFRAAMSLAL